VSETVRTITVTEDKSGVFFATSEDEPPMFCAAPSLAQIFESIERVLNAQILSSAPVFKATQNTAESGPVVRPDCAGADTSTLLSQRERT
jgi:hypothetical protein